MVLIEVTEEELNIINKFRQRKINKENYHSLYYVANREKLLDYANIYYQINKLATEAAVET